MFSISLCKVSCSVRSV